MEIKNNIFYVGVNAPPNSYIVKSEKTALIDTVPGCFAEEYIKNIESLTDISEIYYLICTHIEPENIVCIEKLLSKNPEITVVASVAGIRNLQEMLDIPFTEQIAKDGSILNLGDKTLKCIITPNLVWPDTAAFYAEEDKTLFSGSIMSADCRDSCGEAAQRQYYDKYIAQFRQFAKTAVDKLSLLETDAVCCGKGPVIKKDIQRNFEKYKQWICESESENDEVVIFYASSSGYTAKMACVVENTLKKCGCGTRLFNAEECDMAQMTERLNKARAVVFGTPTVNRRAANVIEQLALAADTVNMRGKSYFVFGSYGWSGEGTQIIHNLLEQLKLRPFAKPFTAIFKPDDEKLAQLEKYTERFAENL